MFCRSRRAVFPLSFSIVPFLHQCRQRPVNLPYFIRSRAACLFRPHTRRRSAVAPRPDFAATARSTRGRWRCLHCKRVLDETQACQGRGHGLRKERVRLRAQKGDEFAVVQCVRRVPQIAHFQQRGPGRQKQRTDRMLCTCRGGQQRRQKFWPGPANRLRLSYAASAGTCAPGRIRPSKCQPASANARAAARPKRRRAPKIKTVDVMVSLQLDCKNKPDASPLHKYPYLECKNA